MQGSRTLLFSKVSMELSELLGNSSEVVNNCTKTRKRSMNIKHSTSKHISKSQNEHALLTDEVWVHLVCFLETGQKVARGLLHSGCRDLIISRFNLLNPIAGKDGDRCAWCRSIYAQLKPDRILGEQFIEDQNLTDLIEWSQTHSATSVKACHSGVIEKPSKVGYDLLNALHRVDEAHPFQIC
jgi:hypothetical protein